MRTKGVIQVEFQKVFNLILAAGFFLTGLAQAQEDSSASATVQLTLQKAEELALSGNPHIRAAEERTRAADKQVLPTLFPDDPTVMVDTTFPGMEMWQVEEKLGFPGKGIAKADMAGAEAKKTDAEAQDTRRSIVLQARQAYWDFYYRSKVDKVLQEAQARWNTLGQTVQSKELSGQWLSLQAIKTQMETAKALNELVTNSRALKISQFNLNHLFSLPHFTAYVLEGEPPFPAFDGKEEEWVNRALQGNPEIAVYQRAIEAQEARRQMASLDYLPDFDVVFSGVKDPNGGLSNYGYRLGVSIPIFFPAKQSQEEGAASDEVAAAKDDLRGKQNEVIHMVEDAYVSAESDWRILQLYDQGGLLQQTQRAWAAAQLSYRNEEMGLSEFVENFNTYLETVTNYYQAQADYGKALAQLDYEAGVLPAQGESK